MVCVSLRAFSTLGVDVHERESWSCKAEPISLRQRDRWGAESCLVPNTARTHPHSALRATLSRRERGAMCRMGDLPEQRIRNREHALRASLHSGQMGARARQHAIEVEARGQPLGLLEILGL